MAHIKAYNYDAIPTYKIKKEPVILWERIDQTAGNSRYAYEAVRRDRDQGRPSHLF